MHLGWMIGRKPRTTPATDLRNRLRHIERCADALAAKDGATDDVKELAYLVGYVAGIVNKHFSDGES